MDRKKFRANTRLLVHAEHAVIQGYKKIQTLDTNEVVLAIANFHKLTIDELCIAFGADKHLKHLPIHSMARNLTTDSALFQCHSRL